MLQIELAWGPWAKSIASFGALSITPAAQSPPDTLRGDVDAQGTPRTLESQEAARERCSGPVRQFSEKPRARPGPHAPSP